MAFFPVISTIAQLLGFGDPVTSTRGASKPILTIPAGMPIYKAQINLTIPAGMPIYKAQINLTTATKTEISFQTKDEFDAFKRKARLAVAFKMWTEEFTAAIQAGDSAEEIWAFIDTLKLSESEIEVEAEIESEDEDEDEDEYYLPDCTVCDVEDCEVRHAPYKG